MFNSASKHSKYFKNISCIISSVNDRGYPKGSPFLVFVAPSNRVKRHLRGGCAKPQRWAARANRETLNSKWDINVHCQLPRSGAAVAARGEQLTVYRATYIAPGEGSRRQPRFAAATSSPRGPLRRQSPRCSAVPRPIRNSRFSLGRSAETNIASCTYSPR